MSNISSRSQQLGSGFFLGPWRVEPWRNVISLNGDEQHLENRLMQTLVFLAEHQGQLVSREQFLSTVWQGLVVNEEALSRAISLLRSALKDKASSPKFIQTIPGAGYRLIADVLCDTSRKASEPTSHGIQENSIAVLPFVNLSEDPDNEYFSDGISEEILNVLAQVKRFKVVGRTSSFAFKDKNKDLRKIGKTLDVSHVLEGSVRKVQARVRITAQLINTDDGFHLWSKTFDRDLDDIFAVQDEIASAVVAALKIELLGEETGSHQVIGGTHDTKAFQAYLLGVHYRNRGALRETVQKAREALEQAIDLDSTYARAHAALAFTWVDLLWNGYVSHEEGQSRIISAATKAIELAPELADGHLALGLSLQHAVLNMQEALKPIEAAMKLNPGSAHVLIEYARINCNLGNHEKSIYAARKAQELDPVSVYTNHFLGHVLYFARHFEEAITAFQKALELDPHYPKPHYFISMCYYWLGDYETALQEVRQESLNWMNWTASAVILNRLGQSQESEAQLARLVEIRVSGNTYVQMAGVYAQTGDTERAIECLNVALSYGDPGLTQMLIDPFLDPLRDHPKFIETLANAGFTHCDQRTSQLPVA